MELDDAIFPNLALHMENYLEEEEAEGRPAAWLVTQAQLSPAIPGSPGGKAWKLHGEAQAWWSEMLLLQGANRTWWDPWDECIDACGAVGWGGC